MRKIYSLLRMVFAVSLLLSCMGQAQAALPAAKSDLIGKKFTFKGTLERVGSSNPTHFQALQEEFEFSFIDAWGYNNPTISNFIVSANLGFNYDGNTGNITVTNKNGVIPNTSGQIYFADATAPEGSAGFNADFIWKLNEDGSIDIPDFTLRDYINETIFAKYTNIKVTSADGNGGGETSSYPKQADLAGKTYTFNSTLTREGNNANYNDRFNALKDKFEFNISDSGFALTFNNFILGAPLYSNYDEKTGKITLTNKSGAISGVSGNNYLAANTDPEDQSTKPFIIQVEEDGTLTFPEVFTVRDFNSDDIYAIYSNATAKVSQNGEGEDDEDEDKETFPELGSFDGWYKYTCSDFSLEDPSYDFGKELTFQIETIGSTVNIKGFFFENVGCEYDAKTGILTLNSLYFRYGTGWVGIAPDGKWTAMSGDNANKMKWQIDENGSISIPDFELITFSGANKQKTIAIYKSGTVEKTTEPEPEVDPKLDFSNFKGEYVFHGTQTTYEIPEFTGFSTENEITQNYNLRFKINEYGQIQEFNGIELDPNKVGDFMNNRGELNDDQTTYTIYMSTLNAIYSHYGEDQEGTYHEYFGGPVGKAWEQDEVAFTLTKNEGGISITDLSLILRFTVSTGDATSETYYKMLTSWTDLEYGEYVAPDFTGIESIVGNWTIPLYDRYADADSQLKAFDANYQVSLDNQTVTFTEIVENKEGQYHLIGKFQDKETILFERIIVGDASTKYPLRAIPFINENNVLDFEGLSNLYQPITAKYDQEEGTLTFPEHSGILYVNADETWKPVESSFDPKGAWVAAFDFNGVGQRTGDIEPVITISSLKVTSEATSAEISMNVETEHFEVAPDAEWTAIVTEVEGETTVGTYEYEATVEEGVATFEITDLTEGRHTYSVVLKYTADSQVITSNSKDFTVEAGSYFELTEAEAKVIDGNTVEVTFKATPYNFTHEDTHYYEVRFTHEDGILEPFNTEAIMGDDKFSTTITDLEKGTYTLIFELHAYDKDKNHLAGTRNTVNPSVTFSITTSAIDGIGVDTDNQGVRYFNLQGVEIANPEKGSIVIKVEGKKASKVLIK